MSKKAFFASKNADQIKTWRDAESISNALQSIHQKIDGQEKLSEEHVELFKELQPKAESYAFAMQDQADNLNTGIQKVSEKILEKAGIGESSSGDLILNQVFEDDFIEMEAASDTPTAGADYENLLGYLPFETIRSTQQYALDEIKKALLDDKIKHIIVEAPTGSGKSGLALCAALASKNAYICTANKNLQDQYLRDFKEDLVDLRGRVNYRCFKYEEETGQKYPKLNCASSPCKQDRKTLCSRSCEYHHKLKIAKESAINSLNIAAYLAFTNFAAFPKRKLGIFDEGHSLSHWLTNFIEILFSADQFARYGLKNIEIPDFEEIHYYAKFLESILELLKENRAEFAKTDKYDAEDYQRFLTKIGNFLSQIRDGDLDNFVLSKEKDFSGKVKSIAFRPVAVDKYAQEYLFQYVDKALILSATILDFNTYATGLGMKPENTRCIRVPSTFPKENRPIYTHLASASLSQKNLQQELPDLCRKVQTILQHYPDQKGIIHGTSYAICKKIRDAIPDSRILFPESSFQQKEILERHNKSTNTVLLSPSMTEGVDLKDDASRFQIIVKCPFPYLGDPVVKKRMELYPNYYGLQTVLTLVQAYGRSVRSEEDWAHTYILDRQVLRVVREQQQWLPQWFIEAIQ